LLPILGILPRSPSELSGGRDSYTWNVSLRPPQKYITNGGLPASFTILFSESLTAAKSRQGRCYNIPLRLWMPPKMYLTVHLPKPGLVIRRSPSPPLHSSASSSRTSALQHKHSTLVTVSSSPISPPTNTQKSPMYTPYAMRFFRSSSRRATSRSESSHHSTERESISTKNPQESSLRVERALDSGVNHSAVSDITHGLGAVVVAEELLPQGRAQTLRDEQKELNETNDDHVAVVPHNNLDVKKQHQVTTSKHEFAGEKNKGSNESNTLLRLIQDGAFKWAKKSTVVRTLPMGVEMPTEIHIVTSNNNSSVSTHATPRRRKLKKNHNDSCSVRIPPLVPEYVLTPIAPDIMPPLPPLVLAATLLTEIQNEEPEENTANNVNEFLDPSDVG
uniref:DUF4210 domain-containing protein n=1 Tax=Hydatigena taeniaeformis TaxID=6205 RepID=A0A0R3WV78_HYDTA